MEIMAWELYAQGYTYADIATVALQNDVSFEDALSAIWINNMADSTWKDT